MKAKTDWNLSSILISVLLVVNASMFSVAKSDELMHGVLISNIQLVVTAFAAYFLLRKKT